MQEASAAGVDSLLMFRACTRYNALITHPEQLEHSLLAALSHATGPTPGPVHIGAYSFIGPHALIEANTRLGRGTLVCAGSFVRGEYPDFVVLEGRPARVVGDSRRADEALLARQPELRAFYDAWAQAPDAGPAERGAAPARPPAGRDR